MQSNLILLNGKIVTMDAAGSTVQALAVSGDRIVAVGNNADVEPLLGKNTRTIDLQGRVVLPGFIDTHVHIDCAAVNTKLATSCHIPPVDYVEVLGSTGSKEAILNFVEQAALEKDTGEWIIGQGRFSLEVEGNSPSKDELDTVAPDHPVMIRYSAHSQLLNSTALEIAGIIRDRPTQEELDQIAPGAKVRRDPASGEPTGVVNECIDWIFPRSSPWKYEDLRRAIRQTCEEASRFGVTGIHEFVSWPESTRVYQELYRDGDLPLRVQLCPCVWGMMHTVEMDSLLDLGLQTGFGNDWIKFGSAKIFVDGEGRDENGVAQEWPRIDQDRLDSLVASAHRVGIRVMMHATSREGAGNGHQCHRGRPSQIPEGGSSSPHRTFRGRLLARGPRAPEEVGDYPDSDAIQLPGMVRGCLARFRTAGRKRSFPIDHCWMRDSCHRVILTVWARNPKR